MSTRYRVVGHWENDSDVTDIVHSVKQVVGIVTTCLGGDCTGFTITAEED